MSGHSKWSTIKRKKGAIDAQRGKLFTKVVKEIIVAVKTGGSGDPDSNASLRMAIQKAKSVNMPKDNIKKAIQKAVGGGEGSNIEEVSYEAYAQDGVALIIECMTDNKKRTLPEVRTVVVKGGGNMADKGSVAYNFHQKGLFLFDAEKVTEDDIMEVALEFDVDDIVDNGTSIEVTCAPSDYESLHKAFDVAGLVADSSELSMISALPIEVTDVDKVRRILNIIEGLEDLDDVQNVYSSLDVSEETLAKL